MGKKFEEGVDRSVDITTKTDIDNSSIDIEPLDDTSVKETYISEQEMIELQNEANSLGIEPFEEIEAIQKMEIDYDAVFEGFDEYDFDGKDFNQDPERLRSLLEGFKEDNWKNLDLDGQKEQIAGLYNYVRDVLGLENPPKIDYYYEAEQGAYGYYSHSTNTIGINEFMLYDSKEALNTIAHELWHTYQHERALNPQTPKDFLYIIGFENYISPSDDFDGYKNQLVEAEAEAFANQFNDVIAQMRRA